MKATMAIKGKGIMTIDENGPKMLVGNCVVIQTGTQSLGDIFIDDAGGTAAVWNGIDWDDIDLQSGLFVTGDGANKPRKSQPIGRPFLPCSHCGTLNPPDAAECGTGRWNGCGGPLG